MNPDIHVVIEHLQGQVADISYIMLAAARTMVHGTGGKVIAVLLGHSVENLVGSLAADEAWIVNHTALADFTPDAYQLVLADLINSHKPRALLCGHTSVGMDIVGALSARLNLPLVSQCREIYEDGGVLKFVSQICGGKIMAEGDLPEPVALITLVPGGYKPEQGKSDQPPPISEVTAPSLEGRRATLKQYIEPEAGDVDIAKEAVLIAVGRGIQREDNIELAEELAKALGAVVCASRPVIDQGWLPTSRLVGKSGKVVKPKLYLALGISGAPEHVESITDSGMIIAINTDPTAPIFDIAQYGVEIDLFDLLPVLTEQIQGSSTDMGMAA